MTTWVLPGILKADDIASIDIELLTLMSKTSPGVILDYVNKFIDTNINSGDTVLLSAAQKLQEAYDEVNKVNQYLQSDEAKNLVEDLCNLQYSDVNAELPIEKLISYRSTILELLAEDADFMAEYNKTVDNKVNGYKTAYTAKLDQDNFDATINRMLAFNSNHPTQAGGTLIAKMRSNQNLFMNVRTKVNSPTVFRRAIYRKDNLKNILRGLDYLIDKKNKGISPRSWRMC